MDVYLFVNIYPFVILCGVSKVYGRVQYSSFLSSKFEQRVIAIANQNREKQKNLRLM